MKKRLLSKVVCTALLVLVCACSLPVQAWADGVADFNTCNSYNSENGLGGRPIYLLGTITDIEKVYENTMYYGTAICVNDVDGYQWYMRADIAKGKYDLFRNSFLGQSGYIFGIYSGYSGVTDRPMMDISVLWPNGMVPFDIKLYK